MPVVGDRPQVLRVGWIDHELDQARAAGRHVGQRGDRLAVDQDELGTS